MERLEILQAADGVAEAAAWRMLVAAICASYEAGEALRQRLADRPADDVAVMVATGQVRRATAELRTCYRLYFGEELGA